MKHGWPLKKVGELFDVQLGKMLSPRAKEGEQFPYLANFNVQWGKFNLENVKSMHFTESEREKYSLKPDDILMCEGGEVGRCAIWRERSTNFYFQKALHRLRPKDRNTINPYFMCIYMEHVTANNGVTKIVGETSIAHLTREKLCALKIPCPSKDQQDKIVKTISTWDTAIEQTERLIAEKEKLFRWLLKKLISDQQDNPAWHKVRIGKLFDIQTFASKSGVIKPDGKYTVVDMGSISREGDLIETKKTDLAEDFLARGDLVMPKDDIGGGQIIGKVAIIKEDNRYVCGDHVYRLISRTLNSSDFLRFAINSMSINKQLRAKANGTSQLGLGKRDVVRQKIKLPCLNEQRVITHMLKSTELEIFLLKQFTEKCRTQKRGLMQKLLTEEWTVYHNNVPEEDLKVLM